MVPLPSESSLLGMFGIDLTKQPYRWPQEQVTLLQVVGEIIAGAIQRKYSNDSHRLRELVAKLAVRFINLPTDSVDKAITSSLNQISELLDFSALEFLHEPPTAVAKLMEEKQRKVFRVAPEKLPEYATEQSSALVVRVQSLAKNYGAIVCCSWLAKVISRRANSRVISVDCRFNRAGTLARKETEQQVERLAYFDELTGLPNRAMFVRYLTNFIDEPSSSDGIGHGAMLFLDLDHFKRSNDNLGREFGDRVLVETAERISQLLEPHELVARLAGDQFLVCLRSHRADKADFEIAQRIEGIYQALNDPYRIAGHVYHGSVSVGGDLSQPSKFS